MRHGARLIVQRVASGEFQDNHRKMNAKSVLGQKGGFSSLEIIDWSYSVPSNHPSKALGKLYNHDDDNNDDDNDENDEEDDGTTLHRLKSNPTGRPNC